MFNSTARCANAMRRAAAAGTTMRAIQTYARSHAAIGRVPSTKLSSTVLSAIARPSASHLVPLTLTSSRQFRHFSASHSRLSNRSLGQHISTIVDDERPDLFYHVYDAPNAVSADAPVYAVSFLQDPPSSPRSCAIIGWLPARSSSAPNGTEIEGAGLNDFVQNDEFRTVLHEAIRSGLGDSIDEDWKNAAIQTQQGWMHVHDMRNVPALGRIGDPDDIIGSVRVEEGKILAETYQPMPSYRLCTADGVLQLTGGLQVRLLDHLRRRVAAENS